MIYPFLKLDDETEIVHSERLVSGEIKVYVEKPDAKDCFHNAVCYLPEYRWEDVNGFTEEEIQKYQQIIKSVEDLIIKKCESKYKTS